MNYFELFAIEQKYDIDQKLLQKQYFSLQTKYHPDRSKNELERSENLEYSMLINEAFKILQDDYLRAEYLLKIKGEFIDDNKLTNEICEIDSEILLIAAGRIPNIEGLGCEQAGVTYKQNGINVNYFYIKKTFRASDGNFKCQNCEDAGLNYIIVINSFLLKD